jgi:phage shock protein PspC (stress-responsive transcriptional regulator)
MIAGVAAGIAERLDIEPIIVRAAFVLLTFFGGSGILLYLLGWLLLPEEGEKDSIAGQALNGTGSGRRRPPHLVLLVVLGVLVLVLGLARFRGRPFGGFTTALVALAALALACRHRRQATDGGPTDSGDRATGTPGPGPWPGPQPTGPARPGGSPFDMSAETTFSDPVTGTYPSDPAAPSGPYPSDPAVGAYPYGTSAGPFAGDPYLSVAWNAHPAGANPSHWWPSTDAARPPSLVPPLLGALAVLAILSAAVAATGWVSVPLPVVAAVGLLISLAAVVAGALRGRVLGPALISLAVAVILVLGAAVPHPLAGGAGERTWHPATLADLRPSYRLGLGRAVLDLGDLQVPNPPSTPAPRVVRASVGTGDLDVTVPPDVAVSVRQRTVIGGAEAFGNRQGGFSVDRTSVDPGGVAPALDLDLRVGIGTIEVRRAAS